MPYTTLVSGTTISAAWANANVRDQNVTPFASSSARSSAISSPIDGMLTYRTDGKVFEGYDGAAYVPAARYNQFALKTVNETVSSNTTLQNDDALLWAVAANATYALDLRLLYNSGATGDLKVQFTAPASATMSWGGIWANTSGALTNPSNNNLASVQSMGGGGDFSATIHGTLTTVGTAGTLQLQWAQNTSDATNTTVYAGSWGSIWRVT